MKNSHNNEPGEDIMVLPTQEPIRLLDDDVIEIDLSFRSPPAYEYLAEADDKEQALIRSIEVGAIALRQVQSDQDCDFINKRMEESFRDLESTIKKAFDPLEEGSVAQRFGKIFQIENQNLKELLCTESKSTEEMQKRMSEFNLGLKEQVFTALEKQTSEGGLGALLGQLRTSVCELRDSIVAGKTEKETSSSLAGKSFEEDCQAVLEEFCKAHGCVCDDLRTVQGSGSSKKGDFRISRHDFTSIVLEMKSKASPLSLAASLSELDQSAQNRNCKIAVLVGDQNSLPGEVGLYNEYGGNGDRVICGFDVLEIGLKIAMVKAKMLFNQKSDGQTMDIQSLTAQIEKLKVSLTKFGKLRSNCASMRKSADKIDSLAEELQSEIESIAEKMAEGITTNTEVKNAIETN
jgi:Uncharacterized protein conserved in bacteria (DUF2130)